MANNVGSITIVNNTDLVREALAQAKFNALTAIGFAAEKHAKDETPVDLGTLRNSIAHAVDGNSVVIGTDNEYAIFVEEGTGVYASDGKGRKSWWVYVVGSDKHSSSSGRDYTEQEAKRIAAILRSKGLDAHATNGIRPSHMLRKAATEHTDEYENIVKAAFEAAE